MRGVLCVGIATQDYVFAVDVMPTTAEKHRARNLAVVGGGIAATAAVTVSRLGGRAMLITRLGDDDVGEAIVAALAREGVDCSLAPRTAGRRSPLSSVIVDSKGERLVVSYSDPEMPLRLDSIPSRLPPGVEAVMADTRWEEGGMEAFAAARASGGVGVLDADRAPNMPGLCDAATHVAYGAQALREMTGRGDVKAALAEAARSAANWVAVTDGERGVYFTENGAIAHEPAFPITPVDTLGAGDVFHGALALGLAEGMGERLAVRFASAAAAIKCTRFGGRAGAPTRGEVEELMKSAA
jgi:sulfofructose kinase